MDIAARMDAPGQVAGANGCVRGPLSPDELLIGPILSPVAQAAFRELSEAADDAFVTFDRFGLIFGWNSAAARLFGYGFDDVLGKPTTVLMPEAEVETQQVRVGLVLDGERINRIRAEGKRRDGTLVPVTLTMTQIDSGRGGLMVARDLTEEHLAQATLSEAELRLQEAQKLSHVGLWLWDATTDTVQISEELYRIYGMSPLEFEGTLEAYLARTHPEDRDDLAASVAASFESGDGLQQEYRVIRPDGSIGWIYSRADVVMGPDGPVGLRGVAQDVTDRERAAEALRAQASLMELLRGLAVAANEAADLDYALETCVTEVCGHTGWPVGRVVFVEDGLIAATRIVHATDPVLHGRFLEAGQRTATWMSSSIDGALRSGQPIVTSAAGPDADDTEKVAARYGMGTVIALPLIVGSEVVAVVQFFGRDQPDEQLVAAVWHGINQLGRVVERGRSRDELSYQALHDILTGLPNRGLLMDRLRHALGRQTRQSHQVALIFFDLDNFKLINDSLGHETGDDLVVKISHRLERVLRPQDTGARFGGDEFIVLCDNLESEQEAVQIAERILMAVSQPISLQGNGIRSVTASAGIAVAAGPGISAEALLRDAGLAMYKAKAAGRGRYQLFDAAMHQRATERLTMANELRTAIVDGQLRLAYQPQVSVATGDVLGVEALVRWQHPERGLLGPTEFIAVAEDTHLIVPLGAWVLTEACRQGAAWREQYPHKDLKLCVNVSTKQLARPELFDEVAVALTRSGLPPSLLCLEITESVLMGDAEFFLEALLRLKLLGVAVAIDDFGTGYSSLAYLRRYPIDVIKVDKGFVDGLDDGDPRSSAVVAAVVDLAHALGAVALAEGVETAHQRALLHELGCDECQGYYFSPPAEPSEITALLGATCRLEPESLECSP